jgi:GT2 family glycosyltransferase
LGAGNSKGHHLVFLDSDILVPKNFLEDLANQFKEADVIQYVRRHILPEKSNSHVEQSNLNLDQDTYIEESHYWKPFFTTDSWISMPFFWKYTCTYCLAVRADDFFSVGRFKRTFVSYGFEDTDLGYRLANKGLRLSSQNLQLFI